jgi:hypothetical protein
MATWQRLRSLDGAYYVSFVACLPEMRHRSAVEMMQVLTGALSRWPWDVARNAARRDVVPAIVVELSNVANSTR